MTYKQQLFPWCIIRPLPNMREAKLSQRESRIVGRFRRRVDAEGHLQVLKRLIPAISYEIMFDITPEDTDSENLTPQPLSLQGKGEQDTPLLAGEGQGERSTEE